MRLCILLLVVSCALVQPGAWAADRLVVIVHPDSGVRTLTRAEATNIFMGRFRKLPSGIPATPVDIAGQSRERQQFYRWLLDKDLAEIDAYWARLVFSGQTTPPLQAASSQAAVKLVAGSRNAIAYVNRAEVTSRVQVVFELDPGTR